MTSEVERLSAELVAELTSSDRRLVDPRYAPARFSNLKNFASSALHYAHAVQHYRGEESLASRLGTTKSKTIGSGAHALVFGTPRVEIFKARRAGKVWDAFEAQHAGAVILNEKEHAIASGIARALTTDMLADTLLFAPGTQHEREITWEVDGQRCAGRIDALGPAAISDLKAVKDANPRWFPFQAARMHWHVQATWYADGCERAGLGWRHPHLVAVENKPPFPVVVWRLDDETIAAARETYMAWLDQLRRCCEANEFPGYSTEILPLRLPGKAGPPPTDDDESDEDEEMAA